MQTNLAKRGLSFLLALAMTVSMVPVQAFATETEPIDHEHCEVCGQHDCICPPAEPEHICEFLAGEVVEPTCGAAGYTVYTCSGCGAVENRDEVPATGAHTYVDAVVGPTEEEQGYTVHTCSVCGDSYKDAFVDPIAAEPEQPQEPEVPEEPVPTVTEEVVEEEPVTEEPKDEKFQREIPADWTDEMVEIQELIDKDVIDYWLGYYGFEMFDETKFAPIVEAMIDETVEVPAELEAEWKTIRAQIEDVVVNKMTANERENATTPITEVEYLLNLYAEEGLLSEKQLEELAVFNPVFLEFADLVCTYGVVPVQLALSDSNIGFSAAKSGLVGDFKYTAEGTTITGTAYAATILNNNGTGKITITNKSGSAAVLYFTYTLSGNGSVSGAISGTSGTYNKELAANEKIEITVQTPATRGTQCTLTINDIKLTIISDDTLDTTFEAVAEGGTYSVDGTTIGAQTVMSSKSGTSYTLLANAVSGYTFVGWTTQDNQIISVNPSFTYTPDESLNVKPVFTRDGGNAVFTTGTAVSGKYYEKAVIIGTESGTEFGYKTVSPTQLYDNLGDAIEAAKASESNKNIVLLNNGTISGSYTIPSGVSLLIPCDMAGTLSVENPVAKRKDAYPGDGYYPATPTAYRTLTMTGNASLSIEGTMNVNAVVVAIGGSKHGGGAPFGGYGYVKMADGASITVQNGGKLSCYGYINGSGTVTAESGAKIYESFQFEDFRGGTVTSNMSQADEGVFPLSAYYVQNIMVPLTLKAGATEGSYASLHMSSATFGTGVEFISSNNAMFNLKSGSVTKRYDHARDRLVFDVNGEVQIAGITMGISSITMNSADFVLPINSNMTVNLLSGSLSLQQEVALLPGAEVNVKNDANCTLVDGGALYLYDSDNWGPFVGSRHETFAPAFYVPERQHTMTAAELKDAQITIEGSVTAQGDVFTTAGGAAIKGTEGAVVYMTPATSGLTYQYEQDQPYTEYSLSNGKLTPAKLLNADGTYYETTSTPKDETGNYITGYYLYEDGVWHYRCLNNAHTPGAAATCGKAQTCTVCDAEIAPPTGKHTAGAAATCTTAQTCTVCGETLAEALNHKNGTNPTSAVTPKCYDKAAGHLAYYTCKDCGVPFEDNACTKPIADLAAWLAEGGAGYVAIPAHTWNEGQILTGDEPTCTKTGTKTLTCKVCSGAGHTTTKTETVPATGHLNVTPYEKKSATCTAPGLEAYWYCSDCRVYFSDAECTRKIENLNTWMSSGGEGYIAALGHQNITEYAEVPAKCNAFGTKAYYTCGVCGKSYTTKVTDTQLSGEIDDLNTWLGTIGQGKINTLSHTEKSVGKVEATCLAPGKEAGVECAVCGTCISGCAEIPVQKHEGTEVEHKDATCTEAGFKAYYQCKNGCKAYFEDAECTKPINDLETWKTAADGGLIKALGHNPVLVPEVPKTCTTTGTAAHYKCQDRDVSCGAIFKDKEGTKPVTAAELVIAASHNPGDAVTENLNEDTGVYDKVIYCQDCTNADGTPTELSRITVTPGASVEHSNLITLDRVDPTCTKTGLKPGAYCADGVENGCPACMQAGKTYMVKQEEIPALGHSADPTKISLSWTETSCTASTPCVRNCGETVTETAEGENFKVETIAATCEAAGSTTYTAIFTNETFGTMTKTEPITKLTHDWGEVEYVWSEDCKTCTATQTCKHNTADSCVRREIVNSTNVVTNPTCVKAGYTTYTADFQADWATDQTKTVDGEKAKGHTWTVDENSVNWTGKTCKLHCNCGANADAAFEVTQKVKQEDTCEQAGEILYTGTFKAEGNFEGDTMPEDLTKTEYPDAVKHIWSEISYDWADDKSTCTASMTCGNDPEGKHKKSQTVNATKDAGTATCTNEGVFTYTAVFTEGEFADKTDTATTKQPALGHKARFVEAVSPTCQKTGTAEHYKCDRCQKLFRTEEDAQKNAAVNADDLIMATVSCSFVNYVYNNDASCTKAGTKTASCAFGCGNTSTIDDADHPKLDHVYTNYVYNNDASCLKAGTETAECDTCDTGAKDTRNSAEHPQLEHEYAKEVLKAPTCTTAGTMQLTCVNGCNAQHTEEIKALGHAYELVSGQAATCYAEGWKDYYQCTRDNCGLYFANNGDTTPIVPESWKTGAGKTNKVAHDYESVVTAPTCLEKGYTTYTCKNDGCTNDAVGHSYVDNYTDALTHKYDTGVVTTQPTCTAAGVRTFTCQNECCTEETEGHTYTKTVEPLGHELVKIDGQAPTCDAAGYNAYYQCAAVSGTGERSHCGYYFASESDTAADAKVIATTEDALNTWKTTLGENGGAIAQLQHKDTDNDHLCDQPGCDDKLTECVDENADHNCDFEGCKKPLSECVDNVKDHLCDYAGCQKKLSDCADVDADQDHLCDHCGQPFGGHEFTEGQCNCGYVQDLRVTITIVAEGTSDQTLPEESIKYGNNGAEYTKVLDLTSYGDCYTIRSVSAKVGAKEVESTYQGNTLTIASELLTGDIVITVNAHQSHVHGSTKTDITAAKCGVDGKIVTTLTCKNCGKPYSTETEIIPALEHEYNGVYTKPTFDTDGFTTYTCKNGCGDSYIETDAGTKLIAVAMVGTQKFETLEEAIDAAGGIGAIILLNKYVVEGTQVWDLEDASLYIANVEGNYGLIIKGDLTIKGGNYVAQGYYGIGVQSGAKLTIDDGVFKNRSKYNDYVIGSWGTTVINGGEFAGQYNCINGFAGSLTINGGEFETKDFDATGEYESSDVFAEEGVSQIKGGTFSKSVEDYLAEGYCQVKDGKTYEVDAHSAGEPEEEERVDPDCVNDGSYKLVTYCTRCEAKLSSEDKTIDALGHTVKVVSGKDATCLEPGYHEAYHCTVCNGYYATRDTENGKVLSDKIEDLTLWQTTDNAGKINALGHNLVHTEAVSAACETSGLKEYWQCDRCKAAFEDEQENTPIADLAAWKAEGGDGYIPATDHNYTSEVTKAPTCTENGERTYTCQNDKSHTYTEVVSKLNHNYVVEYNWNENRSICTASAVCKNNPDHKAQMNAVATVSVTTEAGCDTEGAGVRTAAFTANGFGIVNQVEDVVIPAIGHSFTKYVSNNDATCTEDGTKTASCDNQCGKQDTVTDVGSAKGHSMQEIEKVPATCTNDGIIHHYRCGTCLGRFYDAEGKQPVETGKHIEPALQHEYETKVTDPTCEEQGYTTHTCIRRDHTYQDNFVPALKHEWNEDEVTKAPTCTEPGTRTFTCVRGCTKTAVEPATGHKGQYIQGKAGTCDAAGWKAYYQCQNSCGLYYEDTNCTKVIGDADDLETWKTTEGAGKTGPYGHDYKEVPGKTPDCDDAGFKPSFKCNRDYCSQYFFENEAGEKILIGDEIAYNAWIAEGGAGYIKPNGHTAGEVKIKNVIAPKCEEDGSHDEVTYCADCEKPIKTNHVVVGKTGHTAVEDRPGYAPTCTATGLTDGKFCTACNNWTVKPEVIKANGHTPVIDEAVEATCTATGLTEGSHCGVCDEPLKIQTVVPMKEHSHTVSVSITPATCTEDGSQVLKCATCNDTKTVVPESLKAKGHNTDGIIEAVAPTCIKTGLTEGKKCTACGETQVKQEIIPATGHLNVSVVEQVNPDCENNGVKEYYHCNDCGVDYATRVSDKDYSDAITNMNYWKANDGKINKLGHKEENLPAVDPSCTVDGLKPGVKCSVCGDILVEQAVDPAKGHTEVVDKAVDPTCTATGLTEGKHCSVCDWKVEQEVIPATGHLNIISTAKVDPDCTTDGVKEYYHCTDCGKYYAMKSSDTELADEINDLTAWKSTSGKIGKLGHQEEDIPAVAPSCTETGLTAGKKCTVCGETTVKQDTVPALGHKEVIDGNVDPTCTETGLTEGKHCSICNEVLVKQEVVEAKGHKGFVVKGQAAKCEQDGWKDYYQCSGCKLFFQDLECTQPIADVDAWKIAEDGGKIAQLGHAWDEGRVTTLPTCTEDGVKTFTCGNCNGTMTDAEPKLGHDTKKHDAQHPTYYSAGWKAYETCTRCDYSTYESIEPLGEPAVGTFEEFMTSLKLLEEYANAYAKANPGKDPLWLLIKYVRTGVDRYNSGSWNIMAGYEDEGFAEYVMKQEEAYNKAAPTVDDMINVTGIKNIKNFKIPNGNSVDFGHMFGTMDITYHNKNSINHADVAGWAGDLVDLLSTADRHDVTGTVDEMIEEIGETYLTHSIEGESDQFSQTDMYGDLDGYYFMNEMIGQDYESGMLYSMMSKYFVSSLTTEQRTDYFLKNRLGGVTGRNEIREAVFSEYTGNSVIATLEGTREFKQADVSDMRKACCYAFADYLCKLAGDYVEENENRHLSVFSSETATLAPGITQQISKATTTDGKQVVYYTATADVNSPYVHVYANYKDNNPAAGWGMQRVLDQANAAQAKYGDPASEYYIPNYNVIASVNGSGYNMTTGEPSGVLMMGGVEYHAPSGGFFGIRKDGTACMGSDAEYYALKEKGELSEAIQMFGTILVKDGKINVSANDYSRASRTAIGYTKTGKVVTMVMDGRQEPVSCGGSMAEIAQVMLDAGCIFAVNLDGGGSTTYVARQPGEEELKCVSSPSDGFQRSVSTSWLIVSTAPSSTAFDHAVLNSDVRHMTIGSTVQVTAAGVSATGNPVELPAGTAWAVSDAKIASIDQNGVVTALANGKFDVQLKLGDQIIGTRTLNVVVPDAVYFTRQNMSAVYGESVTLPVAALFENKPVAITEADVTFSLSNTAAGTTEGFTFTGIEASGVKTVKVNAHAVNNPDATSGFININMFKAGEASFDFENADGGDRLLAWKRVVSNSTTVDSVTYTAVDKDKPMVTEYTFGMDMTQIPMPEILEELVYMLPGADVEGNNSAWDFLLQLAERVSVLTEVKATLKLDTNFDVDYSKMSVNCEYFNLEKITHNPETNELILSLRWKDQTKAIDPETANPIVILAGIKLTPKADAAWDAKDRLNAMHSGNISYDIYLRANALYSFASKPENQETFHLYPFVNNDVIIGGAPESGGHFMDVYKEFSDEYTLNKGAKNGWVYEDGGYAYYEDGEKYIGVQQVGRFYYDFGTNGINMGQTKFTGMFQIDGVNHYAKDGLLTGGWHIAGEDKYYFDASGKAVDGEIVLDEVKLIFDNGLLIGGQTGFVKKTNGNTYYYQNGSMYYGWLELGDEWYHFNTESGIMTVGDGTAATKLFPDDEARAKGAYYVFDAEGHALYGFPNNFGYYYWAGQPIRDQWVRNGYDLDGWYHTNDTGHFVTSGGSESYKLELDGVTYDAVKIAFDGVVYVFNDKNGKLLLGSMVLEDGFWYYYWAGEPVNDGWFEFEGDTYYAFENGKLASGAQIIDGEFYMFTERGILIKEGTTLNVLMSNDLTQMTIKVNNVKDVDRVMLAMWSDVYGQDDLEWFEAINDSERTWTVKIDPLCQQYKDIGRYQVHAYEYHEDGTMGDLLVNTIYDLTKIGHKTGKPVKQNVVAPTCTSAGGYDLVTICEACNEVIKTEHVVEPAVGNKHVYDDNVDGTCNVCGVDRATVEKRQVVHMLRMYNPYTGEHFYTGSVEEKDNLVAVGWNYEGVAFTFPSNTGAPVHRLYDPVTGEHLYTMDEEEKATLMAEGWNYEGIAFNSAYDTEAVQHRLHNPYATVGAYHFTFSEEEKQDLINAGWEYQGIGWYSCWK